MAEGAVVVRPGPEEKGKVVSAGELPPWEVSDLPEPPPFTFPNVLAVIGPGAILLGTSIGSGEWLLGPATVASYGLAMFWIVTVSAILQVFLNMEFLRYTLYSGEPIFTGFMRLKPGPTFWGWFWVIMFFLQVGWPGWAGTAAGSLATLALGGRLPGPEDARLVAVFGILTFVLAAGLLLVGRRIERTLELANYFMIAWILIFLVLADVFLVPISRWGEALLGFVGFSPTRGFMLLPPGADFLLLGGFAAYTGAGGCINASLTNWARDKGWAMGGVIGYIPSLVGGQRVTLSHTGKAFQVNQATLRRWRGWWRFAGADQYGLWLCGAFLGMLLPGLLAAQFLPAGQDIRGLGIAATVANELNKVGGTFLWLNTLIVSFWILFSTQLGIIDGFVRSTTDIVWTGSRRMREMRGGDVRTVYYLMLAIVSVWGVFLLSGPLFGVNIQPVLFIQVGANWAGVCFVPLAVLTLIVNRTFLPRELQPSLMRQTLVLLCALFFLWTSASWLTDFIPKLIQNPGQYIRLT
jgi:hypothetical protein